MGYSPWGHKESDTTEHTQPLIHTESGKGDTDGFICRAAMEKLTWRTDLWTWGGGTQGEDEKYGGCNMETHITVCNIHSQWEFAVWLRELKQGLCISLEEGDGEGDGRETGRGMGGRFNKEGTCVYLWLIHVDV